jgi:hypothetical protein
MPLNWDLRHIADKDREGLCWRTAERDNPDRGEEAGERYMTAALEALIWATMALGVPVLDAKTLPEFTKRLALWERVHGAYRQQRGADGTLAPKYFTAAEVAEYSGLRTNASRYTPAQFLKRLYDTFTPRGA